MQQSNRFIGRGEKMSERTKERIEKENKEAKNSLAQQSIDFNAPGAVDEYLRNFLRKAGLTRTLNSFDSEWYDVVLNSVRESLKPEIQLTENAIPDASIHRQLLQSKLEEVRKESDQLRQELLLAPEILVRLQRETFFHQQQSQRTCNEKTRLEEEIKKLQKQLESYEQALEDLEKKHEESLRQKALLCLEQERAKNVPRQGRECLLLKERRLSSDCTDKISSKSQRSGLGREAKLTNFGNQMKLQQLKVQQVKLQQIRVHQVDLQHVKPQQVKLPETDPQQLKLQQPKTQHGEGQPVKPQQTKNQKLDYYEIDFQQFRQEENYQGTTQQFNRNKTNVQQEKNPQEVNQQVKPQSEDQLRLNPHHSSNCKINLHQLKKQQKNQQVKSQQREHQQVKNQQVNRNEVKIKIVKHQQMKPVQGEEQDRPEKEEQQQVRSQQKQQKQHQRAKPQQKQPQLEQQTEVKPQQVNRREMKMKHLKYHQMKLQQIKDQIPKMIRKPKLPSPFPHTCVIQQLHQYTSKKIALRM